MTRPRGSVVRVKSNETTSDSVSVSMSIVLWEEKEDVF